MVLQRNSIDYVVAPSLYRWHLEWRVAHSGRGIVPQGNGRPRPGWGWLVVVWRGREIKKRHSLRFSRVNQILYGLAIYSVKGEDIKGDQQRREEDVLSLVLYCVLCVGVNKHYSMQELSTTKGDCAIVCIFFVIGGGL